MPVFEGWKLWKRNMPTTVYDPRVFGAIFVGYIAMSVSLNLATYMFSGIVF